MTRNNYPNSIEQLEHNFRLDDPANTSNLRSIYSIICVQGDALAHSDDRQVDGHIT